jgi:hypothetical protein
MIFGSRSEIESSCPLSRLENGRASFDFAQDEENSLMPPTISPHFLMPSEISPHPELVEGRTMPMQRTRAITLALLLLLFTPPALAQQEPPYTTPQGNAAPAVTAMGVNPTTGKAVPENNLDGGIIPAASLTSAAVLLGPIDTTGYGSIVVAITAVGGANTVLLEESADLVNWFVAPASMTTGNSNSGPFNGISGQPGLYYAPALARYVRARVSVYSAGTITASAILRRASVMAPPFVTLTGLNQNVIATGNTQADGVTLNGGNNVPLFVQSFPRAFNGGGFDLQRNNADLGSVVTAGIASQTGALQINYNGRGVVCIINITAFTGTSITFTLKGRDNNNGVDYPIGATAALTATGTYRLEIYPGITPASSSLVWAFSDILPRAWHLDTTDSAVTAITATTDCQNIN